MRHLFTAARHGSALAASWVQIAGDHGPMRSETTTRLYYIISGRGWFEIGDDPRAEVSAGDAALVEPGVSFVFGGHFSYLLVTTPHDAAS